MLDVGLPLMDGISVLERWRRDGRTMPVLIYETAFKGYRLSEAATVSVIATILLLAFALVTARALDREES